MFVMVPLETEVVEEESNPTQNVHFAEIFLISQESVVCLYVKSPIICLFVFPPYCSCCLGNRFCVGHCMRKVHCMKKIQLCTEC